jgi:inhibitor of KinA sporulation pathway (predicted exonuclease)
LNYKDNYNAFRIRCIMLIVEKFECNSAPTEYEKIIKHTWNIDLS